jgi:hypothetical protein
LKGKPTYDSRIAEYNIMKEMGWTKGDLDKTPEYDVMSCAFITGRIHKREEIELKKRGK